MKITNCVMSFGIREVGIYICKKGVLKKVLHFNWNFNIRILEQIDCLNISSLTYIAIN